MNPITEVDVKAIFQIAGIPVLKTWELVHSYISYRPGEDEETTRKEAVYRATRPSWLVKTPYGLIQLNLRKRVVEIDWSDTGYKATVPPIAFGALPSEVKDVHPITTDNVTKSEIIVHAWDLLKATEYLDTLCIRLIQAKQEAAKVQV